MLKFVSPNFANGKPSVDNKHAPTWRHLPYQTSRFRATCYVTFLQNHFSLNLVFSFCQHTLMLYAVIFRLATLSCTNLYLFHLIFTFIHRLLADLYELNLWQKLFSPCAGHACTCGCCSFERLPYRWTIPISYPPLPFLMTRSPFKTSLWVF